MGGRGSNQGIRCLFPAIRTQERLKVDETRWKQSSLDGTISMVFGLAGVIMGAAANAFIAFTVVRVVGNAEPGEGMRPMGLALALVLFASAVFGGELGCIAACLGFGWRRGWAWALAGLCVTLAIAPFFYLGPLVRYVADVRGIVLGD